jgi:hypothetical protein
MTSRPRRCRPSGGWRTRWRDPARASSRSPGSIPDDFVAAYVNGYGEHVRRPGWLLLAQAVDHAREHRSHVATILTQLGITPPDIDVWAFEEAGADAGLA